MAMGLLRKFAPSKSSIGSLSLFHTHSIPRTVSSCSRNPCAILRPLPSTQVTGLQSFLLKGFSSADGYGKEMDEINSKFAEAREEIELALESKETVYFNDEAETARAAVKDVLERYEALLGRLDEAAKGSVQRSMGLKMEQLKAELTQLNSSD